MGFLEGKRAVVTGSSRGIGRAYAKALAAEGAQVVVNGTTKELVLQVVDEIRAAGATAVPGVESVATIEGAERLIKTCIDSYGGIDILVNNAGVVAERMMFNMTEQEFKGPMMVDCFGTFFCSRFAAIQMRQQRWGRIVNTGDSSPMHGLLGGTNVGAAKGGIHTMTMIWAIELRKYNITSNCIIPGAYSRTAEPLIRKQIEVRLGRGEKNVPTFEEVVAKMVKPEEITPFLVYLCSNEADWITGQIMTMNKGKLSLWSHPTEIVQLLNPDGFTLEQVRARVRPAFEKSLQYLAFDSPWIK